MKRRATPKLPPAGWCAAIGVALVVGASGCASTSSLQWYEPAPAERSEPLAEALEVLPVIDERPLKGRTSLGPGFLAIIPLVPYGHQQISPDRFTGNFPSEILGTVVADVRAAGVARQVFQKGDLLPGQAAPENAYTLHLRLTEGIFHRNVTLYGVSFFGAFLALVGLPTSYGRVEIGLDAEVRNATGESLGREQFRGTAGAKDWLYYPMPAAYPRKLPESVRGPLSRASPLPTRGTLAVGRDAEPSHAGELRPPSRASRSADLRTFPASSRRGSSTNSKLWGIL